jgi:SAM-dependent methyltransferase
VADRAGGPLRLNLGCNADVRPGWVNVDIADYGGNEIIDLNSYPWPFEENSVAEVSASHVLEHLDNFNAVVTELWRICEPDALIDVAVPFFLSTKFYSEPDHRIPFGIRSFDNYEFLGDRNLKFYERWKLSGRTNYQSPARFVVESKRFHFSNFAVLSWLDHLINVEPVIFERFFATLFTPEEVLFRLRVMKAAA